jgi:GNAT superfamily N-acetyltransferase
MSLADVPAVEVLTDKSFYSLDVATRPANWPAPETRDAARSELWRARATHLVTHDGPGCWVCEDAHGLTGVAMSVRRELFWGLSSYAVHPSAQSTGIGKALLKATLRYSEGCLRGMICSSHDPRAARRYRLAGFSLHPAMLMWGQIDRSALPVVEHVRDGTPSDFELMDSVDRRARGGAHGVDHDIMIRQYVLQVIDHSTGSGYCYLHPTGGPHLLAATNRRTAQRLLWTALAATPMDQPASFHNLTAEQEWAIDVGFAAGMEVHGRGYLALRHMRPPTPYIPSGHFL